MSKKSLSETDIWAKYITPAVVQARWDEALQIRREVGFTKGRIIVRLPNSVFKPHASIGTNLLFFEKGEPTKEVWFYEHRVPAGQKAYSMTKPIRFEHLQPCIDWWGGAERKGRQESAVTWKVSLEEIKARNYNLDCKNPHMVADDHGDPAELLAKLEHDEQRAATLRDQLKNILAEALLR